MDNYPDDIRQYDSDPRSPFYVEPPQCPECGSDMTIEEDYDEDMGEYTFTYCEACDG